MISNEKPQFQKSIARWLMTVEHHGWRWGISKDPNLWNINTTSVYALFNSINNIKAGKYFAGEKGCLVLA